jgi:hypothetical protein
MTIAFDRPTSERLSSPGQVAGAATPSSELSLALSGDGGVASDSANGLVGIKLSDGTFLV